ncbi:unnamed protein product [Rhodiola kirilowii]
MPSTTIPTGDAASRHPSSSPGHRQPLHAPHSIIPTDNDSSILQPSGATKTDENKRGWWLQPDPDPRLTPEEEKKKQKKNRTAPPLPASLPSRPNLAQTSTEAGSGSTKPGGQRKRRKTGRRGHHAPANAPKAVVFK